MTIFQSRIAIFFCIVSPLLGQMAYANNGVATSVREQTNFEILYHEVLPPMVLESKAADHIQHGTQSSAWTWSFESFGKSFDLILESNDRLLAKLSRRQRKKVVGSHQLYRGKIDGIDQSWVRLTRTGKKWYGMIWDGYELYVIDPMSVMEPALPGFSLSHSSAHGIYRLSDTRQLEAATCGLGHSGMPSKSMNNYGALVQELQERVSAGAAGPLLNIDMTVVADVEFSHTQQQTFNTSTNAAVIARINVVDGIFSEQVGVQINLVEIQELSDNGSLTSTDPLTLLRQFGALTSSNTFDHPGVAQLFTGRKLNGNTVGIAYLNSLCSSRFGVGVSEVRGGGTIRALVVAHELGHNFGAPHDNQSGSICESTPGTFLMNPIINGSDQFSQCSITEMQPALQNASCISVINFDQSDLQMTLPNSQLESNMGVSFEYTTNVRNIGSGSATNVEVVVTVPTQLSVLNTSVNDGSCASNGNGQITCDLADVPSQATRSFTLTLQGSTVGQFSIHAVVSASNDQDSSNNVGNQVVNIINVNEDFPAIFMNFQPGAASVPGGYQADHGAVYTATRGYGWSEMVNTRERHARGDQRLDTFIHFDRGTSANWRYDLPNGTYEVTLESGDPSYPQGPHHIAVEGVTVLTGQSTAVNQYLKVTKQVVTVTDGALTLQLSRVGGSSKTILNYVMITAVP
ncbi:MAG: M12 family metallo-peptidase [Nitrospirales bacterium]